MTGFCAIRNGYKIECHKMITLKIIHKQCTFLKLFFGLQKTKITIKVGSVFYITHFQKTSKN